MRERKNYKTEKAAKDGRLPKSTLDEPDKVMFGRTIYDLLSAFFTGVVKYPVKSVIIAIILITAVTVVAVQKGVKFGFDKNWKPVIEVSPDNSDIQKRIDRIDEMVKKGKEKGLAYVVLSIIDRSSVEREVSDENKEVLKIRRQRSYVIRALRKIQKTENIFIEQYPDHGRSAERVIGSNNEISQTGGNWTVELEMDEGEVRTFWTNAVFSYDLPLADDRLALSERIQLAANEFFLSYQNDNDMVGEILIQIESTSFRLVPVGKRGARRFNKDDDDGSRGEVQRQDRDGAVLITSLSARWPDILPRDEVGIYFRMEDPSQPPTVGCQKPHARIKAAKKDKAY